MNGMEKRAMLREQLALLEQKLMVCALFKDVTDTEVMAALRALLKVLRGHMLAEEYDMLPVYGRFAEALYRAGGDLGAFLLEAVQNSDNPAIRLAAAGKTLPAPMEAALKNELETFGAVSRLQAGDVILLLKTQASPPLWANTPQDFVKLYGERLAQAPTKGYGIYAGHHMFTLQAEGELLCPVRNPDSQRLADLTGYEREREQIVLNTKALLQGLPANNILLYGDAGTGKSSTVKALANEFRDEGLRLVEVRKDQLYQIPGLMDTLADNPLTFILFIDDLSFPANDGDFTALKAILEGNVSARPRNIVVYATSNRRHMVKERFSDRQGDDLHVGDTLEESASLSDRFGLTVTFLRPDRDLYSRIVLALAKEYGLVTPQEELLARAERHAIRYGGRSPRTARQFVELAKAQEALLN